MIICDSAHRPASAILRGEGTVFLKCRRNYVNRGRGIRVNTVARLTAKGWGAEGTLVATDQQHCHECGEQNRASALFCRNCGSPLDAERPVADQESEPLTSDIPARAPIPEYGQTSQTENDWKSANRNARRAGMAVGSPRPWAVALLAALLILGVAALAGWQADWPKAIFGAQKATLISPAAGSSGTPANSPASAGAASSPEPLPQTPNPEDSAGLGTGPAAVVQAYFSAINDRDYSRAWQLGGSNLGESYSAFMQGFSTTAHDTVSILSSSGNVVTAQLIAQQSDGSTKTFDGTYTVTNGVITNSSVQQTG